MNACTIHAKEDRDLGSPKLPPIPKKIDDEFEESVLPKILGLLMFFFYT